MKLTETDLIIAVLAAIATALITGDSLAVLSVAVLLVGLKLLATGDGLPVLALAFSYQWMQVTIGLFYTPFTGRQLLTPERCNYRPMVLVGLACVAALGIGLRLGIFLVRRRPEPARERPPTIGSWSTLLALYVVALIAEPVLNEVAQTYPSLRQVLITVLVTHLALLFLIIRRLSVPTLRWQPLLLIVAVEVARGFTGYYAGFREPLVLGAIVVLEVFDRRRFAHWVGLAMLTGLMVITSVMWMGVRTTYRAEFMEVDALASSQRARFDRISDLGASFFRSDADDIKSAADALVDRLWTVYYPSLALERVPESVPHTHGALLKAAITHVLTPRVLYPDKPSLVSDSELVRKYSGVWVAGAEQNTSIAFGYAGESYVDFGVPVMFLPPLVFGILMGVAYAWLVRHLRHQELMVATVNVIFWLALYLFERSWANTLGNAVSLLVYLAIPIALVDEFLFTRYALRTRSAEVERLV